MMKILKALQNIRFVKILLFLAILKEEAIVTSLENTDVLHTEIALSTSV